MKFFKVLRCDLERNSSRFLIRSILVVALFMFLFLCFIFEAFHLYAYIFDYPRQIKQIELSLGDVILIELGGMFPKSQMTTNSFTFPTAWFFTHIVVLYFTLDFAHEDYNHGGIQIFTRLGNLKVWWFSKCVLSLITVAVYYVIGYLTFGFLCLATNKNLNLQINSDIFALYFSARYTNSNEPFFNLLMGMCIMPAIVIFTMSICQMTLTLFVKPVYAFIVSCIYFIFGIFYTYPILISNYAMPVRSAVIGVYNFDFCSGILICSAICIIAFYIGGKRLKYIDIM